jgi:peptidoglycan hydrolase-like protein with peptidoglycan-binding domain
MKLTKLEPLPLEASREQILARLGEFKVTALNIAVTQLTDQNAHLMEPREVKQLTDLVLSLEDTIRETPSEGKEVRTIQRLLDKYGNSNE